MRILQWFSRLALVLAGLALAFSPAMAQQRPHQRASSA